MRIFLAGATGVLGRRATVLLVAAGHAVTAVGRGPEKRAWLQRVGARPVDVSLFDADALRTAVQGHDAVVNLATKIPPLNKANRPSAWAENTRIRTEGARNLAAAAIAAGAQVYVQESIAFLYGEHGGEWVDASTTPIVDSDFSEPVKAAEASAARVTEAGGRGVVLRFGTFQAGESAHTHAVLAAARRGVLFDVVPPEGYLPTIDADDAAAAVVAALAAPAGVYDVVDEPVTRAEYARALAAAVGRSRLHGGGVVRRVAGKRAGPLASSQRVSGTRFTDATGWRPRCRTVADAIAKAAVESGLGRSLAGPVRLLLWLLVPVVLFLGMYASLAPRAFYDDFPFGRGWVAHDGPYNEHLIRDFGALNLALAVIGIAALLAGSLVLTRAWALGYLAFAVPHAVYHFRHLEHYDTGDKFGNVISLTSGVFLAAMLLWLSFRPARGGGDGAVATIRSGAMTDAHVTSGRGREAGTVHVPLPDDSGGRAGAAGRTR
jgi:nucleoside-diphosphate-sugar epimerase